VLAGWFPVVNSEGNPLDNVLSVIYKSGYVPDFYDFLLEAKKNGWNKGSIKTKIETAVSDVLFLNPKEKKEFFESLEKTLNNMGVW